MNFVFKEKIDSYIHIFVLAQTQVFERQLWILTQLFSRKMTIQQGLHATISKVQYIISKLEI